jgi:hypothetical protein
MPAIIERFIGHQAICVVLLFVAVEFANAEASGQEFNFS